MAAVKDKMRIRLKGYDHMLLDQTAERIVETAREPVQRFRDLSRFPLVKKWLQSFVRFTSIRIAVSSLSSELTNA